MSSILSDSTDKLKELSVFLKKQQENKKFISTLEISVTFLLVAFFLFFAIKPTVLTIASLVGDIKAKEITNTQMKAKIDNLMKAQESYTSVEGRFQIIESSLPSRPGFYESFDQIKETLANAGTVYSAGSFDLSKIDEKNNTDPNVKNYSVSLTVKTPFQNSLNTVADLLSNRRILNISSVTFNNDVNKQASGVQSSLTTNFGVIFSYWQK